MRLRDKAQRLKTAFKLRNAGLKVGDDREDGVAFVLGNKAKRRGGGQVLNGVIRRAGCRGRDGRQLRRQGCALGSVDRVFDGGAVEVRVLVGNTNRLRIPSQCNETVKLAVLRIVASGSDS